MGILDWLKRDHRQPQAGRGDTETVRRIVAELDRLDPARARYVAAFAYILGRVAMADLHISPEETRVMERVVSERGGLPEEQAVIAVQIAKSQNQLFGGTEDFLVTREFGSVATEAQRLQLLECLFAVAASDGSITHEEDQAIARVAAELKIEHADLVKARLAHRQFLAILRRPAGGGA
jgi:uncharacterized tellurite resistance protein B-like protein